jgi:hypothetical protein
MRSAGTSASKRFLTILEITSLAASEKVFPIAHSDALCEGNTIFAGSAQENIVSGDQP